MMDWRSLLGFAMALGLIWAVARAVREAANIRTELVAQLIANRWSLTFEPHGELWVVVDPEHGEDLGIHKRPAAAIQLALDATKGVPRRACSCPVQYGHDPLCPRHGGAQ